MLEMATSDCTQADLSLFDVAKIPAAIIDVAGEAMAYSQVFSGIAKIEAGILMPHDSCKHIDLNALIIATLQQQSAKLCVEGLLYSGRAYHPYIAFVSDGKVLLTLREVFSNISDAEKRELHTQISEMESAKVDFEELAFAACHDLRSPLRALSTIPLWITTDIRERFGYLPESISEHSEGMVIQAKRLNTMLDDLLVYATIGSSREKSFIKVIDWEALAQSIWEELHINSNYSLKLKIEHQSCLLPINEFTLVSKHLLRNAVNHHDRNNGCVELVTQSANGIFSLRVSDDGPGIDRALHREALKIFGTLRSRDNVEGSGIGLALCKKVASSMRGNINLSTGLQGRGTSVTISVPFTPAEP